MGDIIYFISLLLIVHYIADFLLQSDEEATQKSKSYVALASHVGKYSLALQVLALYGAFKFGGDPVVWISWVLFNTVAHFGLDAVTSRMSSKLQREGNSSEFFNVIGMDQLLHQLTLILTSWAILQGVI